MGCCHKEIRECRVDLIQMHNTKVKIPAVKSINAVIERQLKTIASLCEETFRTSAIEDIKSALDNVTEPFKQKITDEEELMSNVISQIEQAKDDFISEDDYFHEHEDDD